MAENNIPVQMAAEQSVLGAMILDNSVISTIAAQLRPDDFYGEPHQHIFETIVNLRDENSPVDLVSLSEALRRNKWLVSAGGSEYLTQLLDAVPTSANAQHYATIVKEHSMRRQLIRASADIARIAYEGADDVNEILDRSEKAVFEISQKRAVRNYHHISRLLSDTLVKLDEAARMKGRITGVPSGFPDLDRMTGGFQNTDLIILAARPAMGKTSLALNFCTNAAKAGVGVGIFSLEMAGEQLAQRILCSEAMVDLKNFRMGLLEDQDWDNLSEVIEPLNRAPIYVDDTPSISMMELKSKARRMKMEHDIGIILVDYLQLITGGNSESRQQQIASFSMELKSLARELRVPVIALSQLSRKTEERPDHKPKLSDLRESGSLEQDADIVMFINREEVYKPETDRKNIADLIIAKHRNGSIGEVELSWLGKFTKFGSLSGYHEN